jgi:hypothetical protein
VKKHRGPAAGYDTPTKSLQTKQIWSTHAAGLHGKPTRQVLVMPSIEGAEIGHVERNGFRRQNIHCVNETPAIVAHVQRRYPGVVPYGVKLHRAVDRMVRNQVKIDCAHLDFTSQIYRSLFFEISCGSTARLWSNFARVTVTFQRGREQPNDGIGDLLRLVNARGCGNQDDKRIAIAAMAIGGNSNYLPRLIRHGIYKSSAGTLTMIWATFELLDLVWRCTEGETLMRASGPIADRARALVMGHVSGAQWLVDQWNELERAGHDAQIASWEVTKTPDVVVEYLMAGRLRSALASERGAR